MNYEKKYKEALERARKCWGEYNDIVGAYENKGVCEEIFPELVESDDEKIRKAIRTIILSSDAKQCQIVGVSQSDMFAWLEKQGKENPLKGTLGDVFDDLKFGLDPSPKQGEQKPVSVDLEEASKEYADKNYAEWLDFISGDERDDHYPISEAFKAGAKWQKER